MIERDKHIREMYDLHHRKDNLKYTGADYENLLYRRVTSGQMWRNENLADFLDQMQELSVWMLESNLAARNFFNYTVPKYYNSHNN